MRSYSDEEIKTVIVEHLSWNTDLDASKVLVSVDQGIVTLTGTVKSYAEKLEAYKAARNISGVRAVNNSTTVLQPDKKVFFSDNEIKAALKHAFTWNPHIDVESMDVQVKKGVVSLKGCVKNYSQRLKAEAIASDLVGVKGIDNELSIVCTDNLKDEQISKAIINEIENTDPDSAKNIIIAVKNGVVDISGVVKGYPAEKRVYDAVSHTRGVTGIKNNMNILQSP